MFRASISRYAHREKENSQRATAAEAPPAVMERPGELPPYLAGGYDKRRSMTVAEPSLSDSARPPAPVSFARERRPSETAPNHPAVLAHAAATFLPGEGVRTRSHSEYVASSDTSSPMRPKLKLGLSALDRTTADRLRGGSFPIRGNPVAALQSLLSPALASLSGGSNSSTPRQPMEELHLPAAQNSSERTFLGERRNSFSSKLLPGASPGLAAAIAPAAGPDDMSLPPQPRANVLERSSSLRALVSPSVRGLSGPKSPIEELSLGAPARPTNIPVTVPEAEPLTEQHEAAAEGDK
eukprot:tig00021073_g18004.t1